MKLLLTNDDGFSADGIKTLARHLSDAGHDVWIFAPDRNRSAASNRITMDKPLRIKEHGQRVYSCSGMPADCVIAALKSGIIGSGVDAVLSGINRGANIGTDILYSGTAAAARQAVLYGVPGIAFSVRSSGGLWRYDAMARFASSNLSSLISLTHTANGDGTPDGLCIFVNVNGLSLERYGGASFADEISFREYRDAVHVLEGPDGDRYSFFCGGDIVTHGGDASDNAVCEKGFVAVSRIYAEVRAAKGVDGISFSV